MTEPDLSPLPTCERCRRTAPCVRVEVAFGASMIERSICIADCFRLWCLLGSDLQRRVRDMLIEQHADFFDEPTRRDIPSVPPSDRCSDTTHNRSEATRWCHDCRKAIQ